MFPRAGVRVGALLRSRDKSGEQILHNLTLHIREPEVAALEAIGKLLVIEAEQVQERGMQIMDVNFVFDHVEPKFIGFAETKAALETAASHPHRKCLGMMIASHLAARFGIALDNRCAPKFAA